MPQARGVAIPVVELTPSALGDWALAAITGTEWVEGVTTDPALPPEEETPTQTNLQLTKAELVQTFIERASSDAIRLAQLLASAPLLTSAVVDLLQVRMLPATGISERAEIFVSGLLEETPGGFRFEPEAAELLQAGATSFERWDTFDIVTDYLSQRPGVGGDLRVLIPDRGGRQRLNAHDEPFAAWARDLAEGLGVRYETPEPNDEPPELPVGPPHAPAPTPEDNKLHARLAARTLDRPAADVFAEMIAGLNGRPLNVVDVGRRGIATFDITRDLLGTPRNHPHQMRQWDELGNAEMSERSVVRAARLRNGVSDLLVCTHPDGALAGRAMDLLMTAHPESSALIEPDARVADLIDAAIADTPLYRPYELVVQTFDEEHRLNLGTIPLFAAGARRGDTAEVTAQFQSAAGRNTVLAVVTWVDRQPHLVTKLSAALPYGRRSLTAVLTGPDKIAFQDLKTVPAEEPWSDLVAQASRDPYRPSDRTHLICAVEVSGPDEQFLERLSRIRQLITTLSKRVPPHMLWVSLIRYGAHSTEYQRRRDPAPEHLWAASADQVLGELAELERRGPDPTGYPWAAMVEEVLALVAGYVPATGTGAGLTGLVFVGDRPPYPPRQGRSRLIPCPQHLDWRESVDQLRRRPEMAIGAICDRPPERLDRSWHDICDVPPAHLETVDVRGLIDDLRIGGPAPVHLLFPLARPS